MTTLSIRLPDDMAERLKNIARVRDISLNLHEKRAPIFVA